MAKTNSVFIGPKPLMNYVTSVVMQFSQGVGEVTVKARGKFITKAVDVTEVVRNRFVTDLHEPVVQLSSEQFSNKENKDVRVSAIDITLRKQT